MSQLKHLFHPTKLPPKTYTPTHTQACSTDTCAPAAKKSDSVYDLKLDEAESKNHAIFESIKDAYIARANEPGNPRNTTIIETLKAKARDYIDENNSRETLPTFAEARNEAEPTPPPPPVMAGRRQNWL